MTTTKTAITHLECSRTGERFEAGRVHNLSTGGWPLLVRYDIESLRRHWDRDALSNGPQSMWRYAPLLPVRLEENIVTLEEGFTPLLRLHRLGKEMECDDLWLKDEGANPTGSFKARGLSCAISMCRELGIQKVAIPTAGNAGGAMHDLKRNSHTILKIEKLQYNLPMKDESFTLQALRREA